MNQGFESLKRPEPAPETFPGHEVVHARLMNDIHEFLGNESSFLNSELIDQLPQLISTEQSRLADMWNRPNEEHPVSFDKYKKIFLVNNIQATAGELVASRHWGSNHVFPKSLESSGLGKKLLRDATTAHVRDKVTTKLNHILATQLAEVYQNKDMKKAEGFEGIAKRSLENHSHEQLGVFAEQIMQGTLERIAIDREDLGLAILPGNAAQDVLQKIDFVITTKQKKQGVGVETADPLYNEKHIGVQFTINTSKTELKKDQIEKAKKRETQMDDIVYVALDQKTLRNAITAWEKAGKPIAGPWAFLDTATKQGVLKGLLGSVITEEQLASVLKQA